VESASAVARRLHVKPAYCVAATLGISSAIVLPYTLRQLNREFLPVIAATRWVTEHSSPGAGIVCNSPYVGFYAPRPVTILGPQGPTLDEALANAPRGARYDYVVLHVNAHAYRPEWVGQIERSYRQVLELPDPWPHTRPRKVLVFQSRDAAPRNASRPPRG
jgi:hypothetical protein